MGRSPKYVDEVEKLLRNGWNVKDIISNTNIGRSTVYDVLAKMKTRARYNFKELMTEDYLWKYENTLDNFDKTIRECNDEIEYMKNKYDELEGKIILEIEGFVDAKGGGVGMTKANLLATLVSIQSNRTNELVKLTAQRDKASDLKAKVYNAGPVVNAIDEWVNKTTPEMGESPKILELEKVDPIVDTIVKPIIKPMLKAEGEVIPNINVDDEEAVPSRLNTLPSDNTSNDSDDVGNDDVHEPSDEDLKTLREMKEDE